MLHTGNNMQKGKAMKIFLWSFILLCVLTFAVACNSGTMRGVGSDISRLGNSMQN